MESTQTAKCKEEEILPDYSSEDGIRRKKGSSDANMKTKEKGDDATSIRRTKSNLCEHVKEKRVTMQQAYATGKGSNESK